MISLIHRCKFKYYLRSKMVIPFIKFEIFWESLFTFLLIQIALWHKLDSSSKKEFTKIMQKEWKVNKLCWLFPENTCTNNISSTAIDTWFYFFLGFWPKTSKFTRKEGRYRHKQYHPWKAKFLKNFLSQLDFFQVDYPLDERPWDYHFQTEVVLTSKYLFWVFRMLYLSKNTWCKCNTYLQTPSTPQ